MIRIGDRSVEQDELKQRAAVLAGALAASGVQFGERVAIVLRNDPDFLLLSAACGLLGAVPVPVNWHWRGDELRHVLTHSGSRAAFAHSCFVDEVEKVLPDGVPLIEVPVRAEQAQAYGATAADRPSPAARRLAGRARAVCRAARVRAAEPDLHLGDDRAAEGRDPQRDGARAVTAGGDGDARWDGAEAGHDGRSSPRRCTTRRRTRRGCSRSRSGST